MPGRNKIPYSISIVLISLFLTVGAGAETPVSGPVSGDWTATGSPYIVTGDLEVPDGETLFIHPGVDLLFEGSFALYVHGALRAIGTETDSIRFLPVADGITWRGIRFIDVGEGSTLDYCRFSKSAVEGSTFETGCGGAIYSQNSSPLITHSLIDHCSCSVGEFEPAAGGGAIFCTGGLPQIIACRIRDCYGEGSCVGGGGAISFRSTRVAIRDCEIYNCSAHGCGGAIAGIESEIDISNNIIYDCVGFHEGGGIYLASGNHGIVFNNLILYNDAPDLWGGGICVTNCEIEIAFCTFLGNNGGVDTYGLGGGIYYGGGAAPLIHHCILWLNHAGQGSEIYPGNLATVTYCDIRGGYSGGTNFSLSPLFAAGGSGDLIDHFYLSAVAAGQEENSPCIDAGNVTAESVMLHRRTTRTDNIIDSGFADIGYHYRIAPVAGLWTPPSFVRLPLTASPNPFRFGTTVCLPEYSEGANLRIFNLSGRLLKTFALPRAAGSSSIAWDGRDALGRRLSPGTYFMVLDSKATGRSAGKVVICR